MWWQVSLPMETFWPGLWVQRDQKLNKKINVHSIPQDLIISKRSPKISFPKHGFCDCLTYKATVASLLSPALQSISLIADVRAFVLSRDDGWSFLQTKRKEKHCNIL